MCVYVCVCVPSAYVYAACMRITPSLDSRVTAPSAAFQSGNTGYNNGRACVDLLSEFVIEFFAGWPRFGDKLATQ